jgi:hypothetical protein
MTMWWCRQFGYHAVWHIGADARPNWKEQPLRESPMGMQWHR